MSNSAGMVGQGPKSVISFAPGDSNEFPKERKNELCENCGEDWSWHSGWRCSTKHGAIYCFDELAENERYMTGSMRAHYGGVTAATAVSMNFIAGDDDATPSNRKGVLCVNCANDWWKHQGWACRNTQGNTPIRRTKFSELHPNERYLTPDMSGAYLNSQPTANPPDPQARTTAPGTPAARKQAAASASGGSEWRAWRGTPAAGHCHCGIVREQCEYHR